MPKRDEHGAVAVEFALVLPLLVVILVGTITSGISYSNTIGVTNAVREGARFGATADASQGSWAADVIARTRQSQFDDPSGETSVCVQLWKIGSGAVKSACDIGVSPSPSGSYPPAPAGAAGTCVVQVVAARPFDINAVFHSWQGHATRGAVARYERAATC